MGKAVLNGFWKLEAPLLKQLHQSRRPARARRDHTDDLRPLNGGLRLMIGSGPWYLSNGWRSSWKALRKMIDGLRRLIWDSRGGSHAEYALILAIIGTGIAFCVLWLSGGIIAPTFNEAATCLSTSGHDCRN